MNKISAIILSILLAALSVGQPAAAQSGEVTERVSVDSGENQANRNSTEPAISADGRFVAFSSRATNLVPGDTNGSEDVFVRDRLNGTTERVSVADNEAEANGSSGGPSISADGRFVAFESVADNLAAPANVGYTHVYVRDRLNGTTEYASVSSSGVPANFGAQRARISADGRFVAFDALSTNLVAGDTNACFDVFVHDRQTGTTEMVSISSAGGQGNYDARDAAISADGRFVAFLSGATNLFPGYNNGEWQVLVRDRLNGTTERASVSSAGELGNRDSGAPFISGSGRFVAFSSYAYNLAPGDNLGTDEIYVRDRLNGTTELVSLTSSGGRAYGSSQNASISDSGRFVAFLSGSTTLAPGDNNEYDLDVFLRDRLRGTTVRVSVDSSGAQQADDASTSAVISADGRFVAFSSQATNLVPDDTNGYADVFVRDRGASYPAYLPAVLR